VHHQLSVDAIVILYNIWLGHDDNSVVSLSVINKEVIKGKHHTTLNQWVVEVCGDLNI
jgi:hypothetical protein